MSSTVRTLLGVTAGWLECRLRLGGCTFGIMFNVYVIEVLVVDHFIRREMSRVALLFLRGRILLDLVGTRLSFHLIIVASVGEREKLPTDFVVALVARSSVVPDLKLAHCFGECLPL